MPSSKSNRQALREEIREKSERIFAALTEVRVGQDELRRELVNNPMHYRRIVRMLSERERGNASTGERSPSRAPNK